MKEDWMVFREFFQNYKSKIIPNNNYLIKDYFLNLNCVKKLF